VDCNPAMLMSYFAQQCKDHLHLVLAYSPLGSSLRDSVRYFPSLINCCTIDWFEVIYFPSVKARIRDGIRIGIVSELPGVDLFAMT